LPHPAVIALDMPVNPADKPQPATQGSQAGQPVASLGAPLSPGAGGRGGTYSTIPLYVGTAPVLRYLGITPATINPGADFLTVRPGQLVVTTASTFASVTHLQRIPAAGYTSEPTSLMTIGGLRRQHWTQIQSGWVVQSSRPITAAQLAAARDAAAKAGLTVEARTSQASLTTISDAATAAGVLLALGVLAMAVALIRTEAARDLRTLTAAGGTSTTRRTLTAATAGALALLGTLLGSAGAYLALAAGHRSDLGTLSHVPVLYLAITILGVPVAAALTGWILAGRQPPSISRQALD
jgi:putative ABC transport system permease protein